MRGQWTGHVARISSNSWAKITSERTPRKGKRVRIRPKTRCSDNIEEVGSNAVALEPSPSKCPQQLGFLPGLNSGNVTFHEKYKIRNCFDYIAHFMNSFYWVNFHETFSTSLTALFVLYLN